MQYVIRDLEDREIGRANDARSAWQLIDERWPEASACILGGKWFRGWMRLSQQLQGGGDYYSEVKLRDICARINRKLKEDLGTRGISLSLKTLRASYCQMVIDRDPSKLSQVSATLGHNTTRTTEEFYGHIRR